VSPEEVGARLVAALGEPAAATVGFGQVHVDVPAEQWVQAVTLARDDPALELAYFDWLTGVDELDGGFGVVTHLYSVRHRHHVLLRTRVPRGRPRLASLTGLFAGAVWHERETYEMFGIVFDGHPNLVPLLLPDGFEGNPLRKEFVLASRVAKAWPGAKEPGESDHEAASPGRRRMLPPGVPASGEWGPPAAEPSPPRLRRPGDHDTPTDVDKVSHPPSEVGEGEQ
jgi:NADH-quinone oxidoreductase subunit C